VTKSEHSELTREGIIARAKWMRATQLRPSPAVGKFPYKHRTVAEMDALEAKG
jgi:hypothetical protein